MTQLLNINVANIIEIVIGGTTIAAISTSAKLLWPKMKYPIKGLISRLTHVIGSHSLQAARIFGNIFVMSLLLYLLRSAASTPGPLTGWDVVGIAFWVWIVMLWVMHLLGVRFAPPPKEPPPPPL